MGNNCPWKSKNPNNISEVTNNSNALESHQNIDQKNIINNDINLIMESNNPDNDNQLQNQKLKHDDNFINKNIETNNNNENIIYIEQTDYMNATLQCLSNTTKLTDYFLKRYKYNKEDKKKLISNEYYGIILIIIVLILQNHLKMY